VQTTSENDAHAFTSGVVYDGLLYLARNTSPAVDGEVNGPPMIYTVNTLSGLDDDAYASTWVEAHEAAATVKRVGGMGVFEDVLYVALEPKEPETDDLEVWQYDGATWALNVSINAGQLRAFCAYNGLLYAGFDTSLYSYNGASWTLRHVCPGLIESLVVRAGLLYINSRNGGVRDILSTDGTDYATLHSLTDTSDLPGCMALGPDGQLYVSVRDVSTISQVERYNGSDWTIAAMFSAEFLGVSAMLAASDSRLYVALARRLHAIASGPSAPDAEVWALS
jgi:hypothetical protein